MKEGAGGLKSPCCVVGYLLIGDVVAFRDIQGSEWLIPIVSDTRPCPLNGFLSYSKLKGTNMPRAHGSIVGHGKHNTLSRQESFWWLCNVSGPVDVPLR